MWKNITKNTLINILTTHFNTDQSAENLVSMMIHPKMKGKSAKEKMYFLFRTLCQFSFYIAFLGFSFSSVRDFIQGKSVFQIFQSKLENLEFPDLTFCPRQKNSLAYLKTIKLLNDLHMNSSELATYKIFLVLNSSIVEDYSFTLEESIQKIQFL